MSQGFMISYMSYIIYISYVHDMHLLLLLASILAIGIIQNMDTFSISLTNLMIYGLFSLQTRSFAP